MLSTHRTPLAVLAALLSLSLGSAVASTNCDTLSLKPPNERKNHFFVLTFFGGAPAGVPPDARKAELASLLTHIKNAITGDYEHIADQIDDGTPDLSVLTCDYALDENDFKREDLDRFLKMNAINVIWHAQEDTKPSIVYLSLPRYQRAVGANRRRSEVVTLVKTSTGKSEQDLAAALSSSNVTRSIMLSLSVGLHSLQLGQPTQPGTSDNPTYLKLAKLSLCDARSKLTYLPSSSVVRPVADALANNLKQVVNDALAEVDQRANVLGLDLRTTQPYKQNCQLAP